MENVISVVGAIIVASVIGAFMPFESPIEISLPKADVLQRVSTPKFTRI